MTDLARSLRTIAATLDRQLRPELTDAELMRQASAQVRRLLDRLRDADIAYQGDPSCQ